MIILVEVKSLNSGFNKSRKRITIHDLITNRFACRKARKVNIREGREVEDWLK
jgi:hypothetical protein